MHRSTYEGLLAKHEAFVGKSLAGMARKLGILQGRLEDTDAAFDRTG